MKGVSPLAPHYRSFAQAHSLAAEITKSPTPEGFRISIGFEYIPLDKVASVPRSATAFRREPVPNVLIMIVWVNDGKDSIDKATEYANTVSGILVGTQADKGQHVGYANYGGSVLFIAPGTDKVMSPRTLDPEGAGLDVPAARDEKSKLVFAENYPRLQEIKKRYDPMNIFNKWFPITPAS